jgi:hypothetical protein
MSESAAAALAGIDEGMNFDDSITRGINTMRKSWLLSFSSPPFGGDYREG